MVILVFIVVVSWYPALIDSPLSCHKTRVQDFEKKERNFAGVSCTNNQLSYGYFYPFFFFIYYCFACFFLFSFLSQIIIHILKDILNSLLTSNSNDQICKRRRFKAHHAKLGANLKIKNKISPPAPIFQKKLDENLAISLL